MEWLFETLARDGWGSGPKDSVIETHHIQSHLEARNRAVWWELESVEQLPNGKIQIVVRNHTGEQRRRFTQL